MRTWVFIGITLAYFCTLTDAADNCKFERPQTFPAVEKDCELMCRADPDCTHYHYEFMNMRGFVRCYLYKAPHRSMVNSSSLRCGLRDNWMAMENALKGKNCLFTPTGIIAKIVDASTTTQCLDSCIQDALCTHFNFYGDFYLDQTNVTKCQLLSGKHGGKSGTLTVLNGANIECGFLLTDKNVRVLKSPATADMLLVNTTTLETAELKELDNNANFVIPLWTLGALYVAGIFTALIVGIICLPIHTKFSQRRSKQKNKGITQQQHFKTSDVTKEKVKFDDDDDDDDEEEEEEKEETYKDYKDVDTIEVIALAESGVFNSIPQWFPEDSHPNTNFISHEDLTHCSTISEVVVHKCMDDNEGPNSNTRCHELEEIISSTADDTRDARGTVSNDENIKTSGGSPENEESHSNQESTNSDATSETNSNDSCEQETWSMDDFE